MSKCDRCDDPATVHMLDGAKNGTPESSLCTYHARLEADRWKQGALLDTEATVKAPENVRVNGGVL